MQVSSCRSEAIRFPEVQQAELRTLTLQHQVHETKSEVLAQQHSFSEGSSSPYLQIKNASRVSANLQTGTQVGQEYKSHWASSRDRHPAGSLAESSSGRHAIVFNKTESFPASINH